MSEIVDDMLDALPPQQTQFIYGLGGLIATQRAGQLNFIFRDHLGSTRVVVSSDGTSGIGYAYDALGNVVEQSAFGTPTSAIAYRYTGQEFDGETGLHNFRARLYDSDLFRFYATDPAGEGFTPYAFVGNSPFLFTDPSGKNIYYFDSNKSPFPYYTPASGPHLYYYQNDKGGFDLGGLYRFTEEELAMLTPMSLDRLQWTGKLSDEMVGQILGDAARYGAKPEREVSESFRYAFGEASQLIGQREMQAMQRLGGSPDGLFTARQAEAVGNAAFQMLGAVDQALQKRQDISLSLQVLGLAGVIEVGGVLSVQTSRILFSQASVSSDLRVLNYTLEMKTSGFKGFDPITAVQLESGQLVALDGNRRLLAASLAGIDAEVNIFGFNEVIHSQSLINQFSTKVGAPVTWGNALMLRIGNQPATWRQTYPFGSPFTRYILEPIRTP